MLSTRRLTTSFSTDLYIKLMNVCLEQKSPIQGNIAPIPIGFTVILGILATGNLSGGSMNPARSLGPAVAAGYWHVHYVYWVTMTMACQSFLDSFCFWVQVGPIIGGVCAGLMWKYHS